MPVVDEHTLIELTLDITDGGTPAQQGALTAQSTLTIEGQLTYLACDETV